MSGKIAPERIVHIRSRHHKKRGGVAVALGTVLVAAGLATVVWAPFAAVPLIVVGGSLFIPGAVEIGKKDRELRDRKRMQLLAGAVDAGEDPQQAIVEAKKAKKAKKAQKKNSLKKGWGFHKKSKSRPQATVTPLPPAPSETTVTTTTTTYQPVPAAVIHSAPLPTTTQIPVTSVPSPMLMASVQSPQVAPQMPEVFLPGTYRPSIPPPSWPQVYPQQYPSSHAYQESNNPFINQSTTPSQQIPNYPWFENTWPPQPLQQQPPQFVDATPLTLDAQQFPLPSSHLTRPKQEADPLQSNPASIRVLR